PVDAKTLDYLTFTGRAPEQVQLVEAYMKEQGMFRTDASPDPEFSDTLELDLADVEPSLAGPRRPQDRIQLSRVKPSFEASLQEMAGPARGAAAEGGVATAAELRRSVQTEWAGETFELADGAVVIAAITSCTNTSNPEVMVGAGILAKKAVEAGLRTQPWVKTSLAPGSKVVTDYLEHAGLQDYLDELGFGLVGYGCTTCIGNSGPLPDEIDQAVDHGHLAVAAVLSGNRNFEARVHNKVRSNYLASPPLVVAYALAGRTDIDLLSEPLGTGQDGQPVFLKDIWPTQREVADTIQESVQSRMFSAQYADVFAGDERWAGLDA